MNLDLRRILHHVLEDYTLPLDGYHGVVHWARVLENGLKLAESNEANRDVVQLFAVLHDCRRLNEDEDLDHGPRAAILALELQGTFFDLHPDDLNRLHRACAGHTHERHNDDATIQTCWDADRLDLGRVGIYPSPIYLGTALAQTPEMIRWANDRATMGFVPDLLARDWHIVLPTFDSQ